MNDIEVNTADVREVGKTQYPALAKLYSNAVSDLETASGFDIPPGITQDFGDLDSAIRDYILQNRDYLDGSANHLTICGETLVDMADDLDWTDKDNSRRIENPTSGVDDEVFTY